MELTILGSGTGIPLADRNAPGYLVEVDKKLIMLDAGEGTKRQIVRAGYNLFDLNYIFITHTHVDHVSDLPAILWPFTWGLNKKLTLELFGPPKFKQFYEKISTVFIPTIKSASKFKVIVKEVKKSHFKIDNIGVETRLMTGKPQGHTFSPYEVGYRITYKNKSLVYCGDSIAEYQDDIISLAQDCDLLILEAAKAKVNNEHLDPVTSGRIAQKANVKKLVLTHFYPDVDALGAKKIQELTAKYYKGPIIIAKDLMKIKI